MAITITAEQRDALYGEILVRLSGIDVVYRAAKDGKLETARERGREFADILLLVLNDLDWGDSASGESIELTTAPDVLRRGFNRLLGSAADQLTLEEREQAQHRTEMSETQRVVDICVEVLKALDADGQSTAINTRTA
ncbi:MAG TPA: hypothetical protein VMS11_00120 [Solirubrobacterales bacterium]|nr:hypothetical protein [Solirubrobacterales bacterium]